MLSLFNGMHGADIMSEIVSGRKPLLSAPRRASHMKWQKGQLSHRRPAWPQLQLRMLSFFLPEKNSALRGKQSSEALASLIGPSEEFIK